MNLADSDECSPWMKFCRMLEYFRWKNVRRLSILERLLAMGVDGYQQNTEIRKHQGGGPH
jgi:hypothetical protein